MATSTRNEHLIFENFNTTEATSAGQRWQKYLLRFENMMDAYQIEDDKRKKALLIHHAGEQVFNIFCTFENCKNTDWQIGLPPSRRARITWKIVLHRPLSTLFILRINTSSHCNYV